MAPRQHLGKDVRMPNAPRPSFLGAYLVAANSMGAVPLGVVRRERNVWRILRFGVPSEQQPREALATREEAGIRLMEMADL
jgi:hypothetical protein